MDTSKEDKKLINRKKNKEVTELERNSYSQKSLIKADEDAVVSALHCYQLCEDSH